MAAACWASAYRARRIRADWGLAKAAPANGECGKHAGGLDYCIIDHFGHRPGECVYLAAYSRCEPNLRVPWKSMLRSLFQRVLLGTCAVALFATGILAWFASAPSPAIPESRTADLERPGDVDRGRFVFHAGGCASCHATPGQQDRLRLGGGLALASMFGTFHPPNISPDPDYGIGRWRTRDLANALMSGVSPSGKHYYPALPYVDYAHMTIEDVRDLMAYLRTLQPVRDKPPPHELPFPMSTDLFVRERLRGPPSVSLLPHIGRIKRMPTKNGPGGPASASDSMEPSQVRTRLSAGGEWIRTSSSGDAVSRSHPPRGSDVRRPRN